MANSHIPPDVRFEAAVVKSVDGGCWIWTGYKSGAGYGQLNVYGKKTYAHRYSYEKYVGPIAEGLELDHLCRNRGCCNPQHLEPVTHQENMRRGFFGSATHCRLGHPYEDRRDRYGFRRCLVCNRAWQRAKYARRKAAASQQQVAA